MPILGKIVQEHYKTDQIQVSDMLFHPQLNRSAKTIDFNSRSFKKSKEQINFEY